MNPPVGGYRPGWALALVTATCVLLTLDITIVNVALPTIRDSLGSDLSGLQWVITAYTLAFGSVLLTAGSLADATGRKKVFLGGLAVFSLASLACGLAPSVAVLNVARGVQGLGGAFAFAPAMAIIAASYGGAARTKAIAIFGAVTMAAGALGPLAGGALVEAVSWRSMFLINVPLGIVLGWMTLRKVAPDTRTGAVRIDVVGVVTLAVGLSCVTLALLRGEEQGWTGGATLTQAGIGVVALGVFLLSQARGRRPLLDLSLFGIRSFTGAAVTALLARLVSFGLLAYLVLYLGAVHSYDAFDVGIRLLALSLMLVVGGLTSVALAARVPLAALSTAGFLVAAAGLFALLLADATGPWTRLLPALMLLGLGLGLVTTPGMTVAMGVVPAARTGVASGVINSFMPLGTALGTALFGVVFSTRIHQSVQEAPALAALDPATTSRIADALGAGRLDALAAAVPAGAGETVITVGREALTDALGALGVVGAAMAVLAALLSALLIRSRDLRHTGAAEPAESNA